MKRRIAFAAAGISLLAMTAGAFAHGTGFLNVRA